MGAQSCEGCRVTDEVRAEFLIPTVESKIKRRRLGVLSQCSAASLMLRALLQEGCLRLPWARAIVGDLVALQPEKYRLCRTQHKMVTCGLSLLWRTR